MFHLGPVPHAELAVDVLEVRLDGVLADEQACRYFMTAEPVDRQPGDFNFPARKPKVRVAHFSIPPRMSE